MDYKPKNILVTGGAGFIGCNFVRYMLATYADIHIVNLDKLTYAGRLENLADLADHRHHFVHGDICDKTLVHDLMHTHNIDTIVHFAAESHVDRSIAGPDVFIQSNIIGTLTLLEAARSYWLDEKNMDASSCRFHHISTDEVYGTLSKTDPAFTETTAYAPNSPYSASKASSDHLVRAWQYTYQLPTTMSNCSNNYGPYQHQEKLIPTVIRACKESTSIPVYGDGSNIRDWLFVTDHCIAIDYILRQGQVEETYNVGGLCECNNLELVKNICNIMDNLYPQKKPHQQLIEFVTDRPGHDWRYAINQQKITSQLNWNPSVSLLDGLTQTVKWYLNE